MAGTFRAEEKIDNKYMITPNEELYKIARENLGEGKVSSFNIIAARVLGVTYAEFLRWARDNYNGTIIGKGYKYPYVVFYNKADCNKCCLFLTKRLNGLV